MRQRSKGRRLVVDGREVRWLLSHRHDPEPGHANCAELVTFYDGDQVYRLVFEADFDKGRLVPDGNLHAGQIRSGDGKFFNLNLPGVARRLFDAVEPTISGPIDAWEIVEDPEFSPPPPASN